MSDINSKKDNSTKIGDYGKKLGLSILKFCILILIGCLILYASKSCGSGVLDIIIPTYYIEGLTDTLLFKPNECSENERSGEEYEQQEQFLNTQYINRVKGDDNQSLYQELNFSYNSENQESVWTSLNDKLKIIRDQMRDKTIGDKNPTKKKISFFELFVTGIISNVSIFNLTFLNSYFKFLNNKFSDSATIIFGPFISMIILLIIAMMTMCVTVYYILYNVQWLVLNTAADIYDPSDLKTSFTTFYQWSSNILYTIQKFISIPMVVLVRLVYDHRLRCSYCYISNISWSDCIQSVKMVIIYPIFAINV